MGYKVDNSSLYALQGAYNAALGEWSQGLSSVMNAEAILENSTQISGNNADHMKAYLNNAYSFLGASLSRLLGLFQTNFTVYRDEYLQQIDAADGARIMENEQSMRFGELHAKRCRMQQIALAAERAASKVSDLVRFPNLDISGPDASLGQIMTFMEDLNTGINALESAHSSGDFGEIDALIDETEAYLKDLVAIKRDSKLTFTKEDFLALPSVPALALAIYNADARIDAQQPQMELAIQHLEERAAREQALIEERERNAEWFKIGVAVVATVACAVAIGTGVGTLLVPVIAGVAKYSLNAMADEYVKHGFDTDSWDRAYIGKEAIKGWFSGFTSGILPPGTGSVVKATVSGANGALWGGLDNVYDQMTTTGKVSDVKSVFYDAAKSGASDFASTWVGDKVGDKVKGMSIGLGLDKYVNPSDDIRHITGNFIRSGTEKVTSGIFERLTSTTVETTFDVGRNLVEGKGALDSIDLGDRYSEVMSAEDLGKDFVLGGIKGTVTNYFKEHTPDPMTGRTPIIQSKLGYETDPETGKTPIIQEALSHMTDEEGLHGILGEMEERNPSTGANRMDMGSGAADPGETPDFSRTSLTPSEERIVREMDEGGEFKFGKEDYSTINSTTDFNEAKFPTMRTSSGKSGTWLGDKGNSGYVPDNPEAQAVMREYGQDSIQVTNNSPSFKPFTDHDTPWGRQECEVGIGHMTGGRQGSEGNYAQADEALAAKIGGGVTASDIRHYREDNNLTWHEVEDGTTMQLIPTIINASVSHTGGTSISGYGQKMGDVSHAY